MAISFLLAQPSFAQSEPESNDCFGYYYGIGVPQSFQKAFKCFEYQGDDIWLILMILNGEGTPQSLKKARELVTRVQQESDCCDSGKLEVAATIVDNIESNPSSLTKDPTKFRICDFAGTPRTT